MGGKERQSTGRISWSLWKAQTVCCLPLVFQKQRGPTRSGCPCLPAMGFGSVRTKVCSVDTELGRKNLNILMGNVHTADGVSAAWST